MYVIYDIRNQQLYVDNGKIKRNGRRQFSYVKDALDYINKNDYQIVSVVSTKENQRM